MCQETYKKLAATTKTIKSKTENISYDDPFMLDTIKSETNDFSDNDSYYMDDDTNLLVFCETIDQQPPPSSSSNIYKSPKRDPKCFVCGIIFKSKVKLKLHMQQFHIEKFTYQCDICKLSCLRKSNLTTHIYRVHINPVFNSSKKDTDRKYKKKKSVMSNKNDDENDKIPPIPLDIDDKSKMTRSTTCKWCSKDYGTRKKLRKHYIVDHPDLFQYKCDICKTYFMRKSNLSCHIQKIHLNPIQKIEKNDDGDVDDDKDGVSQLLTNENDDASIVANRQLSSHQCKECGILCATRTKLLRHCHIRHPNVWNLQCHLCNQIFARQCMLSRHMRRSHQISTKSELNDEKRPPRLTLKNEFGQHCCGEPGCNAAFDMRHKLLTHNQVEHRDVWNLQCHLCSLFFKHRGNFTRHLKNSHGQSIDGTAIDEDELMDDAKAKKSSLRKKRQYDCNDCQQKFENQIKLWQHLATYHSDVYKYECILCKRVFKVKSYLRMHVKKIHGMQNSSAMTISNSNDGVDEPERYSIKCSMCKQTFFNQNVYQEHICQMNAIKHEMNSNEQLLSMQSSSSFTMLS